MVALRKPYGYEPAIRPVRLPRETYWLCRSCRKWETLGDGLCVKCWDARQMSNHKALAREERQDRAAELSKEGTAPTKIAEILGVSLCTVRRDLQGIR